MFGTNAFGEYAFGESTPSATAPVDGQAPTLSAASSAPNGANAFTGSVTTDEGNGTLYYLASTSTSQTAAQVKAGATQAITSAGAKSVAGSGLTASTIYYLFFLHRDAAGNDSAVLRSPSFTTADAQVSGPVTVPLARTALFAAMPRVAVFTSSNPIEISKGSSDEIYVGADFTKDCTDAATAPASTNPITAYPVGVVVLEQPVVQGLRVLIKIGALDPNVANPYILFRMSLDNGEQVDRTITLRAVDNIVWIFGKDPDDRRFFAFDFTNDLALSAGTTLSSTALVGTTGVGSPRAPFVQGKQVIALVSGFASTDGGSNTYSISATLGTNEKLFRTIGFKREDH